MIFLVFHRAQAQLQVPVTSAQSRACRSQPSFMHFCTKRVSEEIASFTRTLDLPQKLPSPRFGASGACLPSCPLLRR